MGDLTLPEEIEKVIFTQALDVALGESGLAHLRCAIKAALATEYAAGYGACMDDVGVGTMENGLVWRHIDLRAQAAAIREWK